MQKTRATTLQAKMGFQDSDLTSPVHDALMVWLDQSVEAWIIQRYGAQWEAEKVNSVIEQARCANRKNLDNEIDRAERHFRTFSNDVVAKELKTLHAKRTLLDTWSPAPPPKRVKIESKTWEKPITARNGFMIGFVDMEVVAQRNVISISGYEWSERWESETYFFEVKPTIPSVGELIRQIRMYQEYRNGKFVVVSPDDRFEKILADQQIHFMKVDE